jgi:hypothetical protein
LGFVAGQLAAIPHAHAFATLAEQRQHDERPHVHFGSHSHGHGHSHGGHSHSHSEEPKAPVHSDHSPSAGQSLVVDHEADAIYLPSGITALNTIKQQRTDRGAGATITAAACPILQAHRQASAPNRPPDTPSPNAKLFLTLRQLRI